MFREIVRLFKIKMDVARLSKNELHSNAASTKEVRPRKLDFHRCCSWMFLFMNDLEYKLRFWGYEDLSENPSRFLSLRRYTAKIWVSFHSHPNNFCKETHSQPFCLKEDWRTLSSNFVWRTLIGLCFDIAWPSPSYLSAR